MNASSEGQVALMARRLALVLVAILLCWQILSIHLADYFVGQAKPGEVGALQAALWWDESHPEALTRLALAAVRDVGPAGHYLGHPHTLENFQRAFYMPKLFDNNAIDETDLGCQQAIGNAHFHQHDGACLRRTFMLNDAYGSDPFANEDIFFSGLRVDYAETDPAFPVLTKFLDDPGIKRRSFRASVQFRLELNSRVDKYRVFNPAYDFQITGARMTARERKQQQTYNDHEIVESTLESFKCQIVHLSLQE